MSGVWFGAGRDLGSVVGTHLFAIAPNNSGSTFLKEALDDLNLRQRLAVKGRYDEMLTNMNERQIARLTPGQVAAVNRVFRPRRDVLRYFGYDLMEPRARNARAPEREGA